MISTLKIIFYLLPMIFWIDAHEPSQKISDKDVIERAHALKKMAEIGYKGDKIIKDIAELREDYNSSTRLISAVEKLLMKNKAFGPKINIAINNYKTIIDFNEIVKKAESCLELYFINALRPFLKEKDILNAPGLDYHNEFKLFLRDINDETKGALEESELYKIFTQLTNNNIYQINALKKRTLMIEEIRRSMGVITSFQPISLSGNFFRPFSDINKISKKYIECWTDVYHVFERKDFSDKQKEAVLFDPDNPFDFLEDYHNLYVKSVEDEIKKIKSCKEDHIRKEISQIIPLKIPIELTPDDFIWLQETLKTSIADSKKVAASKIKEKRVRRRGKGKKNIPPSETGDDDTPLPDPEDGQQIVREKIPQSVVPNISLNVYNVPEVVFISKEESPLFADYKKTFLARQDDLRRLWGDPFFDVCKNWTDKLTVRQSSQGGVFSIYDPVTESFTTLFKTKLLGCKDFLPDNILRFIHISERVRERMLASYRNGKKSDRGHGIDPFTLMLALSLNNVVSHKGKAGIYQTSVALVHRNGKDGAIQVGVDKNNLIHLHFKPFSNDPEKARELADFYFGSSVTPPDFFMSYEN